MITQRVLNVLEYDKILNECSKYAVLENSKKYLFELKPCDSLEECEFLLKKTYEANLLLYTYNVSGIEFFDQIGDELDRAKRGFVLNMAELLRVSRLLKSSRIVYNSINQIEDEKITALKSVAQAIYYDNYLEQDITFKILSEDKINDNASVKLCEIRRKIKRINEQVREKLNFYIRSQSKYLQDGIVTMRGDRYVVPVKSEFRGQIKGLIHDQSSTGSTLFIEPVEVLELNNDLKTATLEEQKEIEAILTELTQKVGLIAERLQNNILCLVDLDISYAKAIYAYKTRSTMPVLNKNGYLNIIKGRHPLIEQDKVVPINICLGADYHYLLITGPNTGGKTVTMKLVGLFTLMAMSGFFIQAVEGSSISFFKSVFCDIGDEQSIEQSLSTFSSHMKRVIEVSENVDGESLVLLDEIGAGTDPDEGSAIARAVLETLVERQSYGIVTTHYSALKEYAFTDNRLKNASMDFDEQTFAPLYRLNIGLAGSSNAIKIAYKLGLNQRLVEKAKNYLSENKINFEKVLSQADKTRRDAEKQLEIYEKINKEKQEQLDSIKLEREKFDKERERFFLNAKIESKRIVNERLEVAQQLVDEIKALFDKDEITSGDLIRARTLKNKLENEKYELDKQAPVITSDLTKIDVDKVKTGDRVYVNSMQKNGVVVVVNRKKQVCDVDVAGMRLSVVFDDLFNAVKQKNSDKTKQSRYENVKITVKRETFNTAITQINVIGHSVDQAMPLIENFIDQAVLNGLEEVKIIHGVGLKILSSAIHAYLKRHNRVDSFRFGKYGEGEHGVTFVKIK